MAEALILSILGRSSGSRAAFTYDSANKHVFEEAFSALNGESGQHSSDASKGIIYFRANSKSFDSVNWQSTEDLEITLLYDSSEASYETEYRKIRTTLIFDLFNKGLLRGSNGLARSVLLDSFSYLPNRSLTSEGYFFASEGLDTSRVLPASAFTQEQSIEIAAIDKFPSLMAVKGECLREDGNRIIPGAMIRDGVHVGKRNIFMFHAAVNIGAYIGDDNLIDSHASVGSAAQIGNKNKLGSFVSLEGVLSPANAKVVEIGNGNFLGSFVRIGTGIVVGDDNFIASGVNLSLGTKLRDLRDTSPARGAYITIKDIDSFSKLVIVPNNAEREFLGHKLLPGEYAVFDNTEDFRGRFEGDDRIRFSSK